MKVKVLVSSCLLGEKVRFDARDKRLSSENLEKLKKMAEIIPFCPEVASGLSVPRPPSEILGDKLVSKDGKDLSLDFKKGTELALAIIKDQGIKLALLKSKSPSCGIHQVYDGTFSGKLKDGSGVCAKLLRENGVLLYDENELEAFFSKISDFL